MKKLRQTLPVILWLLSPLVFAQDVTLDAVTAQLSDLLPNDEAGVAVGLIDGETETVTFVGNPGFTEETLFEFGSITKVFTAIVLAQLAQEGVVQLDESINPYLPEEVQDTKWETVTFEKLATHASGLPHLPSNMDEAYFEANIEDPYADYDETMLYEATAETELEPAGELNAYSNFGYGLLGTLLADVAGSSYAELVETRVLSPLEMSTATVSGWSSGNSAPPLLADGSETGAWGFDAMAGAGAVRGSLGDAVKFLQASMAACAGDSALATANCQAQQATQVRAAEYMLQGLGWNRSESLVGDIVWHNGQTGGFSTFMGFNVPEQVGIVLLANVGETDVTTVGIEFLAGLE